MTLCFQSFNYSPCITCCSSRDTKRKKNHAAVKLPPSILPQPRETNGPDPFSNKPSTDRILTSLVNKRDNGIGIIGGPSVDSSLSFANKLVNLNKLENKGRDLPFVLCSDPGIKTELLSPRGKNEQEHIDQSLIVENLRQKRVFLEEGGVSCIVMPCHVLHYWYDEIKEGCSVELLHMGECVAKELKEAKLRPMEAGNPPLIGVLSANENLVGRIYREKLENEGFEVVMPDKATMEHTVIPAVEAQSRKDFEGAQNLLRIALQVLLVRAVNKIIIASDELKEILPPNDPLLRKCIDPTDALARSTIKYSQSKGRCK